MATGKKNIFAVVVDIVCVVIIGLPCLILYFEGDPYPRGFFCDDETIRHPYKESTIPTSVLVIVSLTVPVGVFFAVELTLMKIAASKSPAMFWSSLYNCIVVFSFGFAVNQLITDICKYSIGRLRPHFLSVCLPNIEFNEETCGTPQFPKYIEVFDCQGSALFSTDEERTSRVKDARLSFVSGHSSMSCYAMLFTLLYLQTRLNNRNYRLVKPLIQVGCSLFAIYTTLSRVSDYKHHPEDVIGGALLGIVVAVVTLILFADRFQNRPGVTIATSTTTLLNPPASWSQELDPLAESPRHGLGAAP